MKKISLKNLNLSEVDQLSREQLKNVLGGYTEGTGSEAAPTTTTAKQGACANKNAGDACSFDWNGNTYTGKCWRYTTAEVLHCSTLG